MAELASQEEVMYREGQFTEPKAIEYPLFTEPSRRFSNRTPARYVVGQYCGGHCHTVGLKKEQDYTDIVHYI
jgi:hypothetical protein